MLSFFKRLSIDTTPNENKNSLQQLGYANSKELQETIYGIILI